MREIKPISIELYRKKLETPIIVNGFPVNHIADYPRVSEYVDIETGEIVTRKEAKQQGLIEIDFSLLALQRTYILSQLSPSALRFAFYVLKFRNARGGITPCLSKLASAYSSLYKLDISNVKRLAKQLIERGVLASDQLCTALFQVHDKTVSRRNHTKLEQSLLDSSTIIESA